MAKQTRRRPYWRRTKLQMMASSMLPAGVMLAAPLYVDAVNNWTFIGFPLGYFMMSHAAIVLAIFVVFHFVARQDSVDRWHGAHEDI